MGIVNDLKKIFFGASSIAKSATEKAGDFIEEEGGELINKAKDVTSQSAELLKDKVVDTSKDVADGFKNTFENIKDDVSNSDMVKGMVNKVEDVGEVVLDKGGDFIEKAKDISETVGEKVIEKGGDILDSSKDLSEKVGEKVLDIKDDLVEKAKEVGDKLGNKLDETMDKADAWAEVEKQSQKENLQKIR